MRLSWMCLDLKGTLEDFKQGLRFGDGREAGMAEANPRPDLRTGWWRDVEKHLGQRIGKSTPNKPVRIN